MSVKNGRPITRIGPKFDKARARGRAFIVRKKAKSLHERKFDEDGNVRQSYLIEQQAGKERAARAYRRIRETLLDLLGGKCVRCGFNDRRALCIDHINGGGTKERKRHVDPRTSYYAILDRGGEGCQVLCCNCNAIKRIENNEHATKFA